MKKLFVIIYFVPFTLFAQFSPGPLSKYHTHLEGNTNCTQCHELRKKELSTGCVDCHSPLKEKIEAKIGYHADKPDKCGECHSDHNGKNFELVYWPKVLKNSIMMKRGIFLQENIKNWIAINAIPVRILKNTQLLIGQLKILNSMF